MTRAIVLAAGRSRRMGTQKLLLPFGGTTVIGRIIDRLLASSLDEVVAVVGRGSETVREALSGRPVILTENPDPGGDMLSSVRCGLRVLSPCEAVLVALGDQPSLTSRLVDAILDAYGKSEKGIVVPVHEGRRGHPLAFSYGYRGEILTSFDEVGLRGLLHRHPDDVYELSVPTPAVLSDMDYPEDYRRELARLRAQDGADRNSC